MTTQAELLSFAGHTPEVAGSAWLAPSTTVIGDVRIGAESGVYFTAVVRGDSTHIEIGERTNLQDGVIVHADPMFPTTIGSGVSIGHRAVVHGCTIADDCLIGMGAVILNGAVIGTGSLIAAGAVVLEGTEIPPGSLVAGVPGKVRRELGETEALAMQLNAAHYVELTAQYRAVC